jgi:hypothetical protein
MRLACPSEVAFMMYRSYRSCNEENSAGWAGNITLDHPAGFSVSIGGTPRLIS